MAEGIANKVTIGYFHCSLCHACLLWMIWKLCWSQTVHCEDCYSHNLYESGELICNALTTQQGFDPYTEFSHLFRTEKPTELPPLREAIAIMQHKIEVIEGAEWHPNYIPSYDRFQDQITEKVNK